MVEVAVALPEQDVAFIDRVAVGHNRSRSSVVRAMVEHCILRHGTDIDPGA